MKDSGIIELLPKNGRDAGSPLSVSARPGKTEEEGHQAINAFLHYDPKRKPEPGLNGFNTPRLYISKECHNLIICMEQYTGEGGKDEAFKDPVDADSLPHSLQARFY